MIVAALALASLSVGPAGAFELTFEGATPPGSGPLSDQDVSGRIVIDLTAGIAIAGGSRDFYLVPEGDFSASIGSILVAESISAVRFPWVPGPRPLSIEIVPSDPALDRLTFVARPAGGSDPFADVNLRSSLAALASGCCTAELLVEPTSGEVLSAAVEFVAVPEPSARLLSPLGTALLIGSARAVGRRPGRSRHGSRSWRRSSQ